MWFLFQAAIVLAVAKRLVAMGGRGVQVGIVGVGLAYLATLIVRGYLDKWATRRRFRAQ
jgi:hypothetical protein